MGTVSKTFGRVVGLAAAAALATTLSVSARETITVYTAVEPEELQGFAEAFQADNSDYEIQWVRDSTGVITAKLLAEGENSPADIVWGLAATSLLMMAERGMLEAYAPAGVEKLSPALMDKQDPPRWVGQRAWVARSASTPMRPRPRVCRCRRPGKT